VLDAIRITVIGKPLGEATHNAEVRFEVAEQQRAGVGPDRATAEVRLDGSPGKALKGERLALTLWDDQKSSSSRAKGV
jgi:hypothetical protein